MVDTLKIEGPVILDSSAVIAWLGGEDGCEVVRQVLRDHPDRLHMHAANVCEVLYHVRRNWKGRKDDAIPDTRETLTAVGILEHAETDSALVDAAATLKANIRKVSLADCLLLALAQRLAGTVVTSDKGEMDKPGPLAVCPIRFIR